MDIQLTAEDVRLFADVVDQRVEQRLKEYLHPEWDWMTPDEAVKLLKFSKGKLYKLTQRKKIPHRKVGNDLRFSRRELSAWIENHEP